MRRALPALAVVVVALAVLSLAFGEVRLGAADWAAALDGRDPAAAFVLFDLRLPRALTAAGAGAALGLSGAIFQTLLRNPLASPDVMGFTSGAALGALLTLGGGGAAGLGVSAGATIGGLAAALAAGALAQRAGRLEPLRMVLVGIGVAAVLNAASALVLARVSLTTAADAQRWLAGSLAARDWGHVVQIWLSLAVLALPVALLMRPLSMLELGDDLAASLGTRVQRARALLGLAGVLAAAAAVSVAGPLPFVALMAPPLAGALAGGGGAPRLLMAACLGAGLTVLADLLGRTGALGLPMQAGVLTGLIGGPWLLWRLSREMRGGRL